MAYVKWTFWIVLWALLAAFLHYTLPQRDIVRIVGTENRRIDFGENSIFWASPDAGTAVGGANRDVFFIQAVRPNGRASVYRNEDTGSGWPPYFKFDGSNLQTEAQNLISTAAAPQWVAIRHYGWRNEFLTIFPNAVSITPVDGPDVRLIPWFNIVVLTLLAALIWGVTVRWRRFKRNRITPAIDRMDDAVDRRRAGFSRWLGTWRSRK